MKQLTTNITKKIYGYVNKMSTEIKLFNKWSTEGITVQDPGLQRYITLKPVFVPKTGARYAGNRFHKSKISIVERFMNKLMIPGHKAKKHKFTSGDCTGKAATVYALTEQMLALIEQKTKKNPVEVLVRAVENAAPREEIITIEYGGARYPKPVECAPQRRVDYALRQMIQAAFQKSTRSKKSAVQALAEEVIAAANSLPSSGAISKKLDLERQADASR